MTTPSVNPNTVDQLVRQMICANAERCPKINSDGHPCRHGIPHDKDSGCAVPCASQRPIGSLCVPDVAGIRRIKG